MPQAPRRAARAFTTRSTQAALGLVVLVALSAPLAAALQAPADGPGWAGALEAASELEPR
jgi:hypothetical protein